MNLRELWDKRWIEITIGVLLTAWFGCAGCCFVTAVARWL